MAAIYSLGVLGMLQAVLLPGLCATAAIKKWNWAQRILLAPPLSLLINHYLIWGLTLLGIYTRAFMLVIVAIETAWIFSRVHATKAGSTNYTRLDRPSELLFLALGVASLTKYAQAWVRNFGDVFQMWDAVVSWNAWGKSWFEGVPAYLIPSNPSQLYPNGIPILFSIPYTLMGRADIETFSKATMGLVYLMSIGALLELGFRRKDIRSLAWSCAFIYPSIQAHFLQSHWNSGYADVPLALMLIFSFCLSYFTGREAPWLFGLTAGTAALVKQPGLLFMALSPALMRGFRDLKKLFMPVTVGAATAAGLWYTFIGSSILSGRSGHNTAGLANLVGGGLAERWAFTAKLLTHFASPAYLAGCLILSALGSFLCKEARRWWLWLGLPYFLTWGTFFAYDIRNLSMALFPLALAVSAALSAIALKTEDMLPRAGEVFRRLGFLHDPRRVGQIVVSATLILMLVSLQKPLKHWQRHGSILAWEQEQRLYLGDTPKANKVFADLADCDKDAVLLTNYSWATVIPQFAQRIKLVGCEDIRKELSKKTKGYVYLQVPNCNLEPADSPTIYAETGVRIFAMNSSLPAGCMKKH
jgi:hypothetical protein